MNLTQKQIETAQFITKFINEHDRHPTYAELTKGLNLKSTGSAYKRTFKLKRNLEICPFCNQKINKTKIKINHEKYEHQH